MDTKPAAQGVYTPHEPPRPESPTLGVVPIPDFRRAIADTIVTCEAVAWRAGFRHGIVFACAVFAMVACVVMLIYR